MGAGLSVDAKKIQESNDRKKTACHTSVVQAVLQGAGVISCRA
jgi:hypothetical protein